MAYAYNSRSYNQQSRETSAGLSRDRGPYYGHVSDSYDLRHQIPDRPSQNRPKSPPLTAPRERQVKRTSWPPPPSVEDERDSLAREYPPSTPNKSQDDGVQMRGTPDQDPIIVEIESRERRFVLVPEAMKAAQSREKPSRVKTRAEEPAAVPRRQPSPYSYTPTTRERVSGEDFLSPDAVAPRKSASPTGDVFGSRHRQRSTESWLDLSTSKSRPESTSDERSMAASNSTQRTPRFSLARTDSEPLIRSVRKDVSASPRSSRGPSPYYENSSSAWKFASERSSRPSSSTDAVPPKPLRFPKASRSESVHSSNPTRPEFAHSASYTAEAVWPPSPPTSPQSANNSPRGSQSSQSGGSRPGSRPTTPPSEHFDAQQASAALSKTAGKQPDRYATFPKPARPTPLTTTMWHEPIEKLSNVRADIQSPLPITPARSTLPYPEDDHSFLMPTEVDFSPRQPTLGVPLPPMDPLTRSRSAVAPSTSSTLKPTPGIRPDPTPRHSSAEGPSKANVEPNKGASIESTTTKPQPSSSVLPPCPRMEYSRKHDDWYTIHGLESCNICPSCLQKIVLPTPLSKFFKRSPPRQSSASARCEFGSPWVRLAWLLTRKHKRQDLDLIHGLAGIAANEPDCPGASEAVGIMYGIQNDQGAFIPSFAVCPLDKRNLETLFPSLIGAFTRFPASVKVDRICTLRMNSKRFPKYLDVIVDIDDKAHSSASRKPDLQPLIDLTGSFAYKQECQRDHILLDQTWHFPPSMPELTVCEECFDEVIYPAVKRGSPVAERFNMSLQPLASAMGGKSTCQLYSPRMRRIWEWSVKNEDWEYLKRKVRERREVEDDLRSQQKDIQRMLQRGGGIYAAAGGVDRERLKKKLDGIALEWADWE